MSDQTALGQDIRALRMARGLTLEALANRLGRSVGWMSQVERGLSTPALSDLRQLAGVFGVPLSLFFGQTDAPEEERGIITRARAGRSLGAPENGLTETLASPDLTDDFEVIHSVFAPGARLNDPVQRPTTELVCLISGRLDLWIGARLFHLSAGDTARIRNAPYRWVNPHDIPAVALWVISPPVY